MLWFLDADQNLSEM